MCNSKRERIERIYKEGYADDEFIKESLLAVISFPEWQEVYKKILSGEGFKWRLA